MPASRILVVLLALFAFACQGGPTTPDVSRFPQITSFTALPTEAAVGKSIGLAFFVKSAASASMDNGEWIIGTWTAPPDSGGEWGANTNSILRWGQTTIFTLTVTNVFGTVKESRIVKLIN